MRDFNFFKPYLGKQSKLSKKQFVIYSFVSVITIALAILPVANFLIIKRMQNHTILVSGIVDSGEVQAEIEEIDNKKIKIQELEEYYKVLESINDEIIKVDIINDMFLQTITDRVPEDIFFQNINISQGSIKITGISKNNVAIAEFEQNLRELPFFEKVFIPSIGSNNGGYAFTISFQIKGGDEDEAN